MADDPGLLTRMGYQPQEPMGGILGGMGGFEGKLPYLAMIAKGLSPYSDIDPMTLMKLAQHKQEQAIAHQFRQQQLDLQRRGVDREDAQFGYQQAEKERARESDSKVWEMLAPKPVMPPDATGDPNAPVVQPQGMTREQIMQAYKLYPDMGPTTQKLLANEMQKIQQREDQHGQAARTRADREELAAQVGAEKGSRAYTDIMMGAKGTKPELTSTESKMVSKAEDELPAMRNTLENLKEALDLTPQSYEGLTAGTRGYIGARVPQLPGGDKTAAIATDRLSQILSSEGIRDMSRTMKGATSDREMKKWLDFAGDLSRPIASREQALKRAISLYEDEIQTREKRIDQLRGGDYYKPQGGQSGRGNVPDPLGIR